MDFVVVNLLHERTYMNVLDEWNKDETFSYLFLFLYMNVDWIYPSIGHSKCIMYIILFEK